MGTATARQVSYLNDLIAKHDVDATTEALIRGALASNSLTIADASKYIGKCVNSPLKRKPAGAWDAANEAMKGVEVSFYAVPAAFVIAQDIDLHGNDFLFLRVRNMGGGRMRISRVHGAQTPRYSALSPRATVAVANIIRGRHVEFAALWHKHSGRCGKCNAVLTDKESRERGLGPDCAKMFGIR